jgi:hypothetical protein
MIPKFILHFLCRRRIDQALHADAENDNFRFDLDQAQVRVRDASQRAKGGQTMLREKIAAAKSLSAFADLERVFRGEIGVRQRNH